MTSNWTPLTGNLIVAGMLLRRPPDQVLLEHGANDASRSARRAAVVIIHGNDILQDSFKDDALQYSRQQETIRFLPGGERHGRTDDL